MGTPNRVRHTHVFEERHQNEPREREHVIALMHVAGVLEESGTINYNRHWAVTIDSGDTDDGESYINTNFITT